MGAPLFLSSAENRKRHFRRSRPARHDGALHPPFRQKSAALAYPALPAAPDRPHRCPGGLSFSFRSERDVRLFSSTNSSPDGPSCPLPFQNRPPASVPPFVLLRETVPYVPVLPNPPVPRAVSSSACTGSNSTARYGITTSCAIRSSGVTTRTLSESLCNTTIYSPR